jgi:hypothetical protein
VVQNALLDRYSVNEKLYLIYKLKNKATDDIYKGAVEIGKKYVPSIGVAVADVDLRSVVKSCILEMFISYGDRCKLWIHWNIPKGQMVATFLFDTELTCVDLSENLGIPKYKVNKGLLELAEYEIEISSTPKVYTVLCSKE